MKGILSMIAVLEIIGWGIGYFGFEEKDFFFHLIVVVPVTTLIIQWLPK